MTDLNDHCFGSNTERKRNIQSCFSSIMLQKPKAISAAYPTRKFYFSFLKFLVVLIIRSNHLKIQYFCFVSISALPSNFINYSPTCRLLVSVVAIFWWALHLGLPDSCYSEVWIKTCFVHAHTHNPPACADTHTQISFWCREHTHRERYTHIILL